MGRRGRRHTNPVTTIADAYFTETLDPPGLLSDLAEPRATFPEIEDGRRFDPDAFGFSTPMTSDARPAAPPVIPRARPGAQYPSHRIAFQAPKKTLVCVRRKERREVLFAKRKSGGGSRRRPHRRWYSDIKC